MNDIYSTCPRCGEEGDVIGKLIWGEAKWEKKLDCHTQECVVVRFTIKLVGERVEKRVQTVCMDAYWFQRRTRFVFFRDRVKKGKEENVIKLHPRQRRLK